MKRTSLAPGETGDNTKTQMEINANEARWKKHEEIIASSKIFAVQNTDNGKLTERLPVSATGLADQKEESDRYASRLLAANKKLIIQTLEKDRLASKLIIADKEIAFQNDENKKCIAESNKNNRLYAFASNVNQLSLHVKDEATLFHYTCKAAVEFGEFRIAWVGLFGNSNSTITNAEHVEMHQYDVALRAGSPQDFVLQSGKHYVCNDILNNTKLNSWKPLATQRDIASCLILPLEKGGIVIGTLNLYSGAIDFFQAAGIELLLGISANISFKLNRLEDKKQHKTDEDLLRRNEQLFRKLIEKSTVVITLSTVIGKMLYCNSAITEALGYTAEEFNNLCFPDIVHPGDVNVFMENRNIISLRYGDSFHYQQRLQHKKGHWIWCEGTDTNRLNEAGINAIVSRFSEISENELAGSQQEFDGNNLNALINSTRDLIWSIDKDFNLITANQPFDDAVAAAFGKSIEKGESALSTIYPAKQLKQYKDNYKRAFAGESFTEVIHFDIPVESWSEISFCPILNGAEIIGAACHSRDITAHKKLEDALTQAKSDLIQSEARLKEAQAIAQVGNFENDLVNHVDIWSDEMYNISGLDRKEYGPCSELFFSLIHPDDLDSTMAAFDECAGKFENGSFEFRFIHKNGEIKYGRTEVRFEFDNEGTATRLFGIFQDITQLKYAEIERTKMVNELMLRNAELEQFGYIVSHNLRAPIANIIGVTTALSDPGLDNRDKEILSIGLTVSALKLDDVVKDLNAILEIKNDIEEPKELVHLSELAHDIKLDIDYSADQPDVELKFDFTEANELFTLKSYLHNIFYSLISNGIKYCRKHVHSIVEVKSKVVKNKLVLIFKDNGLGINLKKCGDKVFGLYNRFHTNIKGKGMGLFMVKAQVEALGGKISVQSEENQGTEFKIEFDLPKPGDIEAK